MKNRKKIEVGGPRAIFFEFERQKSDFESEVGFLSSNFGYFSRFLEILEPNWSKVENIFKCWARLGGVRDDW